VYLTLTEKLILEQAPKLVLISENIFNFKFIGDKGYKECKHVKVCEDKQEKSKRQIIEAVNSQIKNFNTYK
jgi:hypothetical protein